MNIRAVLFDLDGVLLKSMEQHLEAWQHAFRHFSALVKESDFYQQEGRGVKSVVENLSDKYGIASKFRLQIMDEKVAYYNKKFHPEFYNGLYDVLDLLKQKQIDLGVVTGGYRERVRKIINEYFDGYFSVVVTSDDVKNTKPYPEPYLKGATLIGVSPVECLVIENAPLGIQSAKTAGMKVVAITTTLTKNDLKEADFIADSFKEIEEYIKQYLQ